MSAWVTVLAACALAYLLKLAGYLVPAHWLSGPRISRVTALLPVALLTGLVIVQTFATPDHGLTLDARAAGVGVAVVALILRAPFIVVVVLAAGTAALLRHFGWGCEPSEGPRLATGALADSVFSTLRDGDHGNSDPGPASLVKSSAVVSTQLL